MTFEINCTALLHTVGVGMLMTRLLRAHRSFLMPLADLTWGGSHVILC